jgi:hypothetical protein
LYQGVEAYPRWNPASAPIHIDAVIGEAELIVVDNFSCLVRSGKENGAESWLPLQGWALAHASLPQRVIHSSLG